MFIAFLLLLLHKGAVTYHRIALTDAERIGKKQQKTVYPVVKVVSVAMKVVAEGVRSA